MDLKKLASKLAKIENYFDVHKTKEYQDLRSKDKLFVLSYIVKELENKLEIEKIDNLYQLQDLKDWVYADVVFKECNWEDEYSELERTYRVYPNAKFFDPNMIGTSLIGDCLDGIDMGVRLDVYKFKVEYIKVYK